MTPTFTLVTPTADQPTGIALCERFMAAQTIDVRQFQWIVVDDGIEPAALTRGQQHLRRERGADCTPTQSFCRNLLKAIEHVDGDWIVFIEHDDYYTPGHLELLADLVSKKGVRIAGDGMQRYYNVQKRCYRIFENFGACLCQTAISTLELPMIRKTIEELLKKGKYGVDAHLWRNVPPAKWGLKVAGTALGIKGLPGRPGLGLGHRPTTDGKWTEDLGLRTLREWIGAEAAAIYAPYGAPEVLVRAGVMTQDEARTAEGSPLIEGDVRFMRAAELASEPSLTGLLGADAAARLLSTDVFGVIKLVRSGRLTPTHIVRGRHWFTRAAVDAARQQIGAAQ